MVHEEGGEADSKLSRKDGEATLAPAVGGVEGLHLGEPGGETGRRMEGQKKGDGAQSRRADETEASERGTMERDGGRVKEAAREGPSNGPLVSFHSPAPTLLFLTSC